MGVKEAIARGSALVARIVGWANRTKPVRVWNRYLRARGPLLAQGLSFQAVFAVFAALWLAFAIAGFVIRGSPELQQGIVQVLAGAVPGLIDTGDGDGAVTIDTLLSASILGWTGAVAALGLLGTALGWLSSARDAVRTIFGLAEPAGNPLLLALVDAGIAIALGLATIGSAALAIASTAAVDGLTAALGGGAQVVVSALSRAVTVALGTAVNALVLALLYRVLAGIPIPPRLLASGVAIGGGAVTVLQLLGSLLLGGATANPLLVPFAVILGLLIWFSLLCQVLLVVAAWIAETASDRHVDLTGRRRRRDADAGPAGAVRPTPLDGTGRRPLRPGTRPGRVTRRD